MLPPKAVRRPMLSGRSRSVSQGSRRRRRPTRGTGRIGLQPRRDAHRTRTGTAAAVGGGEGLVQVHVDDVEAHVPGPDLAQDGVEVGPVVIEQAAGRVDDAGDLLDVAVEDADGARVGEHDAGGLGADRRAQGGEVHVPVRAGRDLADAEAAHHGGGRIGAVGRVRHQDLGAGRVAAGLVVGADHGHAGELALGPGGGCQRDGVHPGDLLEHLLQLVEAGQDALAVARPAPAGGGRGSRAAWPGCCRPAGCTSWCRSPADRNGCRWRSSSATAGCSGAPPAARRPPAGPAGVVRRRRRGDVGHGGRGQRGLGGGAAAGAGVLVDQHGGASAGLDACGMRRRIGEACGSGDGRGRPCRAPYGLRGRPGPRRSPAPG